MGLSFKSFDKMAPASVKDVDQQKFVVALSAFLKKYGKVKVPEWSDIVKTSVAKELAPYDEDWYYTRLASVASHWCRGPGSVARKALQSLEQLKLVQKDANGGRVLTPQGRRDLDRIASQTRAGKK